MSAAEREQVGHAFGQLVGRLPPGQSLQFYVEALPVRLRGAARAQPRRGRAARCAALQRRRRARADALRRLHGALRESLERHADAQAAVDVAYYVVVPYLPDQRAAAGLARAAAACGAGDCARRAARAARWSRTGGWRASRCSLTDSIRGDLEALDLSTHMLSGPEVLDLLWRRFNPTDRRPHARAPARRARATAGGRRRARRASRDAHDAARAAHALRELVAGSAIDCADQRHLRVDRDLEQALYVGDAAGRDRVRLAAGRDAGPAAVHAVGARARAGPAARAQPVQGAPPAAVRRQPRRRAARPHARTTRCSPRRRSSASCSRSSPGTSARRRSRSRSTSRSASADPTPTPSSSPRPSSRPRSEIIAASDARVNSGQLRQLELWQSSLPLGRDVAAADAQVRHPPRRRHRAAGRHRLRVADRDPVRVHRPRPRGRADQPVRPGARQRHAAGQRALRRRQDVPRQRR